jgi:hypothetical protein
VWALAEHLHEFHEERYWTLLGYETLEEFLAEPEVGMSRSAFFRLVEAWHWLVEVRKVAPARLSELAPSKVQEVLPAIRRGDVSPDDALADAKGFGKRDLREKYGIGPRRASYRGEGGWHELLGEVNDTLDRAERQLDKLEQHITRTPGEGFRKRAVRHADAAHALAERLRRLGEHGPTLGNKS